MSRIAWLGLIAVAVVAVAHGCQRPETFLRSNIGAGAGGSVISGEGGGSIDHGTGGSGTGGVVTGSGGRVGTGGSGAGGALIGTGGRGTGGRGSGGTPSGTGGDLDGGGIGGEPGDGTGGTGDTDAGGGDADAGGDGPVSTGTCIGDIPVFGYTSSSGPPCSECHDNDTPLGPACMVMIDCLVPVWPSKPGDASWLTCLHKAQGSGVVESCVTALTMACE